MAALPTGTVTFLFTDIEGSTAHWEHHPQAMQAALTRHDALLHHAITAHGGAVFKTVGDAFCAVFATAPDALAAALTVQWALQAESWGEVSSLRVRMALHTGAAEAREGDYFGPPLNRVARLLSAGHGGQVLLSAATRELVQDHLPPGAELRDLGVHRLKDLIRPEHIFQLVVSDVPADFPPLKTLDVRRTNLPVQPSPLIGREREVAAVRERLLQPGVRLITLSGPGGTGKTRLGLQVAAEVLEEFAAGVFFVDLAPISDPTLVASTITQTLGVMEAGGQPLQETLKQYLRDKRMLLVLDNFEQVLAAAPLVAELLTAAPQLKVLVTSRIVLHLRGEYEVPVPPLALPDMQRPLPLERLTQYEAVRLFIERAQAVKPSFHVTNATAPAIAEICVRLDGLPLAIELAAARIKLLSPDALLTRLANRLQLLTGGARDLPARQQTLRNTIDWSYSLLDPAEQTLFGRLAVFVGGGTLEAIEAVCNAEGDLLMDPFDGVASLLDKSLLRQEDGPNGEPRFIMLETIHEYARERLEASGEAEVLRRRHAAYYLELAERAEPERKGAHQAEWLGRLEIEHGNLRAAMGYFRDRGQAERWLRLAAALFWFWYTRGYWSEGRGWLEGALDAAPERTGARARALLGAGALWWLLGDRAAALARLDEGTAIAAELGEPPDVAHAFYPLIGMLSGSADDRPTARALLERTLVIARAAGDRWAVAARLVTLGWLAWQEGDTATARAHLEESVRLCWELGERWTRAHALNFLGDLSRATGEDRQAADYYEESLRLFRELDIRDGQASTLHNLAYTAHRLGEEQRAAALFQDALRLFWELGDRHGVAECLVGLAGVLGAGGRAERAARLVGAAEGLLEATGTHISLSNRADYERDLAAIRARLGAAAFEARRLEGRAMVSDEAVRYALERLEVRGAPGPHRGPQGAKAEKTANWCNLRH